MLYACVAAIDFYIEFDALARLPYSIRRKNEDELDISLRERIRNGANLLDSHIFQFDFLNDPFDKPPKGLREIVEDPEKRRKLVIYINPPYAEAGDSKQRSGTGKNKTDADRFLTQRSCFRSGPCGCIAVCATQMSRL